jgi:hypothetical protein
MVLIHVFARTLDLLYRARPGYIVLALGVYAASVPLVALRWQMVLRGLRRDAPRIALRPLVLVSMAANFVNNVTPAARVSGEACRIVALARLGLASLQQAAASVVAERVAEVPSVAVLAAVALVAVGRAAASWLLLTAAIAAAALLFARHAGAHILAWVRARWAAVDLVAVRGSALVASGLLSGAIWLLDIVRLRTVAAAFHAPIGMAQAAALAAITIVAGWVPTIGGLGAVEGGLVAGLIAFGIPPAQAIAVAAVERAISYGVATLAGFGALSALGGRAVWEAMRGRGAALDGAAA